MATFLLQVDVKQAGGTQTFRITGVKNEAEAIEYFNSRDPDRFPNARSDIAHQEVEVTELEDATRGNAIEKESDKDVNDEALGQRSDLPPDHTPILREILDEIEKTGVGILEHNWPKIVKLYLKARREMK